MLLWAPVLAVRPPFFISGFRVRPRSVALVLVQPACCGQLCHSQGHRPGDRRARSRWVKDQVRPPSVCQGFRLGEPEGNPQICRGCIGAIIRLSLAPRRLLVIVSNGYRSSLPYTRSHRAPQGCPRLGVLARSTPEDKRIVTKLLRSLCEIVGVTCDGTDNGPALKTTRVLLWVLPTLVGPHSNQQRHSQALAVPDIDHHHLRI